MLHTQAEAKLARQLDDCRKLLDTQRDESRAQLSALGDEMLRYRAEAEEAHDARGQAEAAHEAAAATLLAEGAARREVLQG